MGARALQTAAVCVVLCAVTLACKPAGSGYFRGYCVYDYDCTSNQEVCGPLKTCIKAPVPEVTPCSGAGTAGCPGGRTCMAGKCRFAPSCLNVSGLYKVYDAQATGETPAGFVQLNQARGTCAVSTPTVVDGGVLMQLRGRLTSLAGFIPDDQDAGCTLLPAEDETLRVICGTQNFDLYAAPDAGDRFVPSRCEPGAVPCNGTRCETPVPNCVRVPCAATNSLGIPQCTPAAL